jgi:uncharacterized zinc-type alcohol dehydrogenase-like protein
MIKVFGYGAQSADDPLAPVQFDRQEPRAGEIAFKVTHCGVCHSDLHQIRDDWENTVYPCVPGHEVVGEVTAVGDGVTKFSVGDRIGVGCLVNSCQVCDQCQADQENYCHGPKGATLTYNGPMEPDGTNTYGGYSTYLVVREEFALTIPEAVDPRHAGPMMCAGITVYSPMKHWNLEAGQTLGVAGIGGLGHMAVKLGKALGAKVVAFTTSPDKRDEILEIGADEVVLSTDEEAMEEAAASLDLMIDTIPYPHELDLYLPLMKHDSTLVVVGNLIEFPEFSPGPMIFQRVSVAGSIIGGIAETQEVLDLCGEHGIHPEVKMIAIEDLTDVMEILRDGGDTHFRHVIDMQSLHDAVDGLEDSATRLDAPDRGEVVNRKVA